MCYNRHKTREVPHGNYAEVYLFSPRLRKSVSATVELPSTYVALCSSAMPVKLSRHPPERRTPINLVLNILRLHWFTSRLINLPSTRQIPHPEALLPKGHPFMGVSSHFLRSPTVGRICTAVGRYRAAPGPSKLLTALSTSSRELEPRSLELAEAIPRRDVPAAVRVCEILE